MHHQHFKYQLFKFNNKFNIWLIFIFFNLITYTKCIKINDFTNFTNLNENFKYDSSIPSLATNSITNFELLKNNVNPDKNIYCGCPPKGQFSDSNLGNSKDVPCKYLINEEAKYACKSGYSKSSGSDRLICTLNDNGKAEWNGKPLNCKSMYFF